MKKLFLCLLLGLIGLLNNVNAQKKLNFLVEPEVGLGCTNISKEIETDGFAVELDELTEHPTTGTGKPEVLKFGLSGFYSRRITQKHRLVYKVDNEQIIVLIISAIGHYIDK